MPEPTSSAGAPAAVPPIALKRGLTDEEIRKLNPIGADYFVDGNGNEECGFCGMFGDCKCPEWG
jgi:hypothetical protein